MVKHENVYSLFQRRNICSASPNILSDEIAHTSMSKQYTFTDHFLWRKLFLITGINIKENTKSTSKCVIWTLILTCLLIHVAIFYLLGLTYADLISNPRKCPTAFLFYLIVFIHLWYLALFRLKRIYCLLPQIYAYRCLLKIPIVPRVTWFSFTILIPISIFLVFTLSSISLAALLDREDETYWFFSKAIESPVARYLLYLLGYLFYSWLLSLTPFLILLAICSVEYHCVEILTTINWQLPMRICMEDASGTRWLGEIYLRTIKILQELRDNLSTLQFSILLFNLTGLCMCLSKIVPCCKDKSGAMGKFLALTGFSATFAMILTQVLYGSWIPEGMERIRETARLLAARYKNLHNRDAEIFFHLEKFENAEPVYMTACGIVNIRKKLILNVLVVLFTYAILMNKL